MESTIFRICELLRIYSKRWRPYRAQTKGKVERAIQYIMDHFYAGTSFESIEELKFLLQRWLNQVANRKANATTGAPS